MKCKPDYIEQNHWNEWLASGVDSDLISLCVTSLKGESVYNYLCYSTELPRNSAGRLSLAFIKRYAHATCGGWWCNGVDPYTGEAIEWGCFKPNQPRLGAKNKLIKYEHPPKIATRAFFLPVTLEIWLKIAERFNLVIPENIEVTETGEALGFWSWVITQTRLPIIITEGAKKAAALLSIGFVAIALPGIWNGRRVDKINKTASLIPDLQPLVQEGREFAFCFDQDTKTQTVTAVNLAIKKTAQLLVNEGKCFVKVITWNTPQKGVDDLIVAEGKIAFEQAYYNALSLGQWNWLIKKQASLTIPATVKLNVADLSTIGLELPQTGIIAIASGKGTGKTKLIAQVTAENERLLSLTHRIFLGRSLAERLGYTWRTDADKGNGYYIDENGYPTWRLGLCVESLLGIRPWQFLGATVVIDEVCQVFRALLTSSTCNKEGRRPAILARFEEIIKVAARVIIADADLDNFVVDYVKSLRGEDEVFLIENQYQTPGYGCTIYDALDHSGMIADTVEMATGGKRLFIATDSLKSSHVLVNLLESGISRDRILVINSETVNLSEQREYVRQINQKLPLYDIVIATPSMSTGVSIEAEWFDAVIGIFYGVVNDADIAQSLARVRHPVPRYIWVAKCGKNFCAVSKSESPFVVLRELKSRWDLEVGLIRMSLSPEMLAVVNTPIDWEKCVHKKLWAQIEANSNGAMWNLREAVIARLKYEGNHLKIIAVNSSLKFQRLTRKVRDKIQVAHYQAVAKSRILPANEKEKLQSQEVITAEERLNLEKTQVAEWAAIAKEAEITPELVKVYSQLSGAILRYEDLRDRLAVERDEKAIALQAKWKLGLFIPNIYTKEQERTVRERLGVLQWIDRLLSGESLTNEDLEPLAKLVWEHYKQVNLILGLNLNPNSSKHSNIYIFNQLIKQLAIPTEIIRYRHNKAATISLQKKRWRLIEMILQRRKFKRNNQIEMLNNFTEAESSHANSSFLIPCLTNFSLFSSLENQLNFESFFTPKNSKTAVLTASGEPEDAS
ncbi:plasmid replication protein, CyRepA1 family [Aerosakkonemataceae cyanobacterium BLCC-F154]|uniref:Plasmid replication protein, CyRepA1 family n=1 Tax=Floridaenema fluviatile BLCC-F154 TaxID=3153640 RepID=A0ABV4YAJ3_9CYAN